MPGLRIEFVTIDVNGNGVIDWDEGFMRVWVPAQHQRFGARLRHRTALARRCRAAVTPGDTTPT